MRYLSAMLDWLGRGFHTVVPETFIAAGAVVLVVAWVILARLYQRCPHCRRLVRRTYSTHRRCRWCGRQYYVGLRPMR
jgi:hypothetical protein